MNAFNLLLTTSLLVVASLEAIAQSRLTEDQIAQLEQRMADTQARLKLTEEQQVQIKPILKEREEARRSVLEKHGVDITVSQSNKRERMSFRQMRSLRSDMQAIQEDTSRKLATILSGEQLAEWQVIEEEQRAEFRKRMQARRV